MALEADKTMAAVPRETRLVPTAGHKATRRCADAPVSWIPVAAARKRHAPPPCHFLVAATHSPSTPRRDRPWPHPPPSAVAPPPRWAAIQMTPSARACQAASHHPSTFGGRRVHAPALAVAGLAPTHPPPPTAAPSTPGRPSTRRAGRDRPRPLRRRRRQRRARLTARGHCQCARHLPVSLAAPPPCHPPPPCLPPPPSVLPPPVSPSPLPPPSAALLPPRQP